MIFPCDSWLCQVDSWKLIIRGCCFLLLFFLRLNRNKVVVAGICEMILSHCQIIFHEPSLLFLIFILQSEHWYRGSVFLGTYIWETVSLDVGTTWSGTFPTKAFFADSLNLQNWVSELLCAVEVLQSSLLWSPRKLVHRLHTSSPCSTQTHMPL